MISKQFLHGAGIFVMALLLFSGCSGTSPELGQYKMDLKNQMQEMINVLNAGHRSEFMSTYVDPTYVTKMGGVDAAVRQFTDSRSRALQGALRVAKNIQPTYDESSKQLTYFSNELQVPIVFKNKGGKWYLQDDWFKL
jgi:hypothetical protein